MALKTVFKSLVREIHWWVFPAVIVLVVALYAGTAWVGMVVWNWLAPSIFNGPRVTFLQACGVMLLLSIVGSFFKRN